MWIEAYTIPSGIKRGQANRQFFDEAKRFNIPIPGYLMPVIEEGSYDQIKECVFQVLALWCFDVLMEDLMQDFADAGFEPRRQSMQCRSWAYVRDCPDADRPMVTEVEVAFWRGTNGSRAYVHELLHQLSVKYGFRYDKVTYDGRTQRLSLNRGDAMHGNLYYQNAPEELSMRLLFPLWR